MIPFLMNGWMEEEEGRSGIFDEWFFGEGMVLLYIC